jgi:iron complex outermembrane recepter protein
MTRNGQYLALWLCTATLCCAQQQLPPPELEEVLVTAQRREQSQQDVPMSLSVFSGDQLAQRQIDNIDALQFAAPNLVVGSNMTSRNAAAIAMRGQFERDASPTVDPAVGLYLDGVYIARTTGANLRMFDLERVEVLRGPQGTLFGRNTVGGAINVIPRLPVPEFEGTVNARLGNYNHRELSGMVNLPFGDGGSALRVTAAQSAHDGYAESALTGRDIADDNTRYARVQLRVAPEDSWSVNLAFDYTRSLGGSQWLTLAGVQPAAMQIPAARENANDALANYVSPYSREPSVNRAGATRATTWGTGAIAAIKLGDVTFKSITALRGLDIDARDSDQDGTPYDISVVIQRNDRQEQFSQEFQVYGGALDARLDWIGGLYYFEEHGRLTQQFPLLAPVSFDPVEQLLWGDVQNESLAAYAQLTYALRPELRFTAGVRYNRDTRQITSRNTLRRFDVQVCRVDSVLLEDPTYCEATLPAQDFDFVPFTVSVDYEPLESTMLYVKASRGQRSGGYNLRAFTAAEFEPFDPEEVMSYEVGAKTSLFDRRLRVDLALYRSLFDDIQISQQSAVEIGLPLTVTTIRNGGEARIEGGELELSALLSALEISAAVGVTDARYTRIEPGATDIRPGSNFLMTPRTTAALALDWPVAWRAHRLRFHADYAWRDDISFWYDPDSLARQESYGLLNATISARFARSGIEVSVWGRNLTDKRYFQRAFRNVFLVAGIPGDPLTCGVAFSYSFD